MFLFMEIQVERISFDDNSSITNCMLFRLDFCSGSGVASRNLVESMGGKIWVESESYLGTKFYFTIPKPK